MKLTKFNASICLYLLGAILTSTYSAYLDVKEHQRRWSSIPIHSSEVICIGYLNGLIWPISLPASIYTEYVNKKMGFN